MPFRLRSTIYREAPADALQDRLIRVSPPRDALGLSGAVGTVGAIGVGDGDGDGVGVGGAGAGGGDGFVPDGAAVISRLSRLNGKYGWPLYVSVAMWAMVTD